MIIRPEKPEEFDEIYDLVKTAFLTAQVSSGDEQNFVNRLRAGEGYMPDLALVAQEEGGKIVGHIMLTRTFVATGVDAHPLLLLAPLSVALDHRKKGLGQRLVKEAFERAIAQGHKAVVVVGDPAYYSRFGFKPSVDFGIINGNDIPTQYVMACELVADALKNVKGSIVFQV